MNDGDMAKASKPGDIPKPFAELGARVARARLKAGLTQAQFASRFDRENMQASRWERGINRCPDRVLEELAEIAKVDLGWLMTGQGTPEPEPAPKTSSTTQYKSLTDFFARHRDMKADEDARSWLASQRFPRERGDMGDDEWWAGQLMRFQELARRVAMVISVPSTTGGKGRSRAPSDRKGTGG
jgi:transcriptional regulator with XRE-family HTH domain